MKNRLILLSEVDINTGRLTRRDFLKSTSLMAAAAGVGVPSGSPVNNNPASIQNQTPQPVKAPVRLGIVGGHFGAQFYWHEHPQCKVVAVSDLVPERRDYMKEVYGCETAYDSLDELLVHAKIDAIALYTSATDMVRHCVQCLDKGLHVAGASPAAMSVDEARQLRDAVRRSGKTYMMTETTFWHQSVISARKWYAEGQFGNIFNCEAEYHHPGLEKLFFEEDGRRTWRYGLPPMLYSTHCTGQLIGVTGERLTEVTCYGWGDDSPILKDNLFKNPFWTETALFKTDRDNSLRAQVCWRGALGIAERASWLGDKRRFFAPTANGTEPIIRRSENSGAIRDDGRPMPHFEKHEQTLWWQTDMLPEPLRHISGHDGSHTFITNEFIDSLVTGRVPALPVELAIDMALPGIIAHQSALQSGKKLEIPRAVDL